LVTKACWQHDGEPELPQCDGGNGNAMRLFVLIVTSPRFPTYATRGVSADT
jgi:hypothetical protein